MISGKPRRPPLLLRAILLLALPLLTAHAAEARAGDAARADAIVASLARPAPARTAFTEVRFVGLLTRPLVLRGEMAWLGGTRLQRRVLTPAPELTEIDGDSATLQRGRGRPQRFPLDRAPELKDLAASFVALLSGNAAALQRVFVVHAYGDARAWTLDLTPRDAQVAQRIRAVSIDGAGRAMRCMRVDSRDGDTAFTLLGALGGVVLPADPTPAGLATLCAGGR